MVKILPNIFNTCLWFQFSIVVSTALMDTNDTKISLDVNEDLDSWKAPKELQSFRYYWSGVDEDCRPIWVGEAGGWDVRKVAETGEEGKKLLEKYFSLFVRNVRKSYHAHYMGCSDAEQFVLILDMENFNNKQIFSPITVKYMLGIFAALVPTLGRALHSGYMVNTNFAAEALLSIAKPIGGTLLERIEIYGTLKHKWIPFLLKKLPIGQLPENLGGYKNFTAVQKFGYWPD